MKVLLKIIASDYKVVVAGILLGVISGILSFLFMAFFNFLIGEVMLGNYTEVNVSYTLAFALITIFFIWSRRTMSKIFIHFSQRLFWQFRIDILNMVLNADFNDMKDRKSEIHATLLHDVGVLTQASLNIIHFITSTVVLATCMSYLFYLSDILFLVTIATSALGVVVYLVGASKTNKLFERSRDVEQSFMYSFNAILNGFKEIQMEPKIGKAIMREKIIPSANDSYRNNTFGFVRFLNNQIIGQVLFYTLISVILLFFSARLDIEAVVLVNFLFILLYVLSSLENLMVVLPSLGQAKVALDRLHTLKSELSGHAKQLREATDHELVSQFQKIKISQLSYSYPKSNNSFKIGPVSFEINKGESIFINGGNGSGKTTLIQTILGVLKPTDGRIIWNGLEINNENFTAYKRNFSVVFNDYYLFDEFFGLQEYDPDNARTYLELFEIEEKVEMTAKGFSTVNLSTGQKKRLALIHALLSQKPIIVLDEWAADQDPYFRKKFYTEILPLLKQEGFTILAITHDDAYYHCCDKLLRMDFGKLSDVTAQTKEAASI